MSFLVSKPGEEKEDCLNSNAITNSYDNNISLQDCTALQDHLLHLKHVNHLEMDVHKRYNRYFSFSAAQFQSEGLYAFFSQKKYK